jgi:O-antigen/teichoic acid export membrane protein
MKLLKELKFQIINSTLIKNSFWGVVANFFQALLITLFFIILARKYTSGNFAHFLIASTVYQLVVAFSSLGLGQWFIRELPKERDSLGFIKRFLKMQVCLGIAFYLISVGLVVVLYADSQIRILGVILGINVIIDNFIYAIRNLNIADFKQKETAYIIIVDSFLRLVIGCILFIYPFSIITLSVFLIVARLSICSVFLKIGNSRNIGFDFIKYPIVFKDIKTLILLNWVFVIIGSVSVIFWRLGNIIISKTLTLQDVANYEISYKFLSILLLLPTIASATIYPQFITYHSNGDITSLRQLYQKTFIIYTAFALVTYSFVYSFAEYMIYVAFGETYSGAALTVQLMTLTFLVFPTVLLQASILVAMKLEKLDMWFNLACLGVNILGCMIGLYYYKSVSVINYSIFGSFLVFHILQDVILVKRNVASAKHCAIFYVTIGSFVWLYQYSVAKFNPFLIFAFTFCLLVSTSVFYLAKLQKRAFSTVNSIS